MAYALVTARVSCLCRSVVDAARTLEMARSEGWNLVLLDLGVDLSTPAGMAMAQMTAVFGELDRRLSSERTRSALVAGRERGARLGRPPVLGDKVRSRIRGERRDGRSLRAIAGGLNDDGVPTGHGGARWHASTVRSVADRGSPRGDRGSAAGAPAAAQ
jgi:DNA invertase Pin-like site-specific DNA recombinase